MIMSKVQGIFEVGNVTLFERRNRSNFRSGNGLARQMISVAQNLEVRCETFGFIFKQVMSANWMLVRFMSHYWILQL